MFRDDISGSVVTCHFRCKKHMTAFLGKELITPKFSVARLGVLTAVLMKFQAFWDMTSCRS